MRSDWIFLLIKGINDIETKNNHATFNNVVEALKNPPKTSSLGNMKQARCGTNGCVYYNARYLFPDNTMRYVAVKTFKDESDMKELLVEVLIQIILSFQNKDNVHLKVPEALFFGKYNNKWVFVMQQINDAVMFSEIMKKATTDDMYAYILRLCNGLFQIQQKFNFMHRDLHGGNILFDTKNNELYMIDFGYSCIGVRNNKQWYSFTYGENYGLNLGIPINDIQYVRKTVTCNNDSHDICMCLLSLYFMAPFKRPKLRKICTEICSAYRMEQRIVINRSVDQQQFVKAFRYNDFSKPVFHWWYLYQLTNIRTKYTPKYLTTIKCLNPLKKYFEKLKF